MMIYALQQLIGMVVGRGGGGAYAPAGATVPNSTFAAGGGLFAQGGVVRGGIKGRDSVPILAQDGEFIMPSQAVSKYGVEFFEMLRKRALSKAAEGGYVNNGRVGTTKATQLEGRGGVYKEGDTINYITIKTNDINSFKEALYHNREFMAGLVVEEQRENRM
jgi:hypothetical protein